MKKAVSILLMFIAFLIIYFLQVNFFTWFNIAGVMPNLFVVLILVIGLFAGKYAGISTKDVSTGIMQVKDVEIPEGKTIIDIVTDRFILEDGKIVTDPVGNLSSSFTLDAQVILADKEYVKQMQTYYTR